VPDGKVVTLLGRNGMGKTTTVRAILGLVSARRGISFDGEPIDAATPEAIARRGIGLVPGGRMVFPTLTAREYLTASAAVRGSLDAYADLRAVSATEGTRPPIRRHAVGRRAADAGDRPGIAGQAEAHDAR